MHTKGIISMVMAMAVSAADGFIFGEPMVRHPQLTQFVEAQQDLKVSLSLDIGKRDTDSRLVIRDMELILHADPDNRIDKVVPMPGVNGMHPNLSGGIRSLEICRPGQFITTEGVQHVNPSKSCWELVWKKDAQAGSLLLGLELPRDYLRNDVGLSKGIIYLNFPVWSQEGLTIARTAQTKAIRRAKECLKERNDELEKMKETPNPLMKVWHYRNAYAAVETYTLQPLQHYQEVVPNADEVINLPPDLSLTVKGSCWTKELPRGAQFLLGTARLSSD